jgi:hypothetical protein
MNSIHGWFSKGNIDITRNKNDWDFGEFSTHQVCELDAIQLWHLNIGDNQVYVGADLPNKL